MTNYDLFLQRLSESPYANVAVRSLGLLAPETVVRAAYRALAKQSHPDSIGSGQSEAAVKFIEIQQA